MTPFNKKGDSAMRFLIVCIFVLFGSITAYSTKSFSTSLPAPLIDRLEQAKQAVWMIIGSNEEAKGTAFFVSPRHVVTKWHVIHDQNDMASLSLQQEGNEQKLSVKRLISVSVLHDLALLETGGSSASHLTVRKGAVSDKEDLFLSGYPNGVFKYTLKTGPLKDFKDGIFIYFFINRTDLFGNSGGPVLDTNNRVVGIISGGKNNYTYMIKGSILREFIDGDIGLNCKGLTPRVCIEKEMYHLQEQAKRGSKIAQYRLGMQYILEMDYYGEGAKNSLSSAQKWYQQAAEQGFPPAQYTLGEEMYAKSKKGVGQQVEQNLSLARKWYRRAAKQGHALAQYSLGNMYEKGEGGKLSFSSARKWYQQAAEQGLALAQYSLGNMYEKGKMKYKHSLFLLKLGLIYEKGEGVEQNLSLAWKWYQRAAEQGHAPAQYSLGEMYEKGKGVEQNLSLARKWHRRAAKQDHAPAQYRLGNMYEKGEGVELSFSSARKWYQRAAEQGHAPAQYRLGEMYGKGEGVEQDISLAWKWYQRYLDSEFQRITQSLDVQYKRDSQEKRKPRLQPFPAVLYKNCMKLFGKGE